MQRFLGFAGGVGVSLLLAAAGLHYEVEALFYAGIICLVGVLALWFTWYGTLAQPQSAGGIARAPTITAKQRAKITSRAMECSVSDRHIEVIRISSSKAAHNAVSAIAEAFRTAGWAVSTGTSAPSDIHSETGVTLGFGSSGPDGTPEPDQIAARDALDDAKIEYEIIPTEKVSVPARVVIYVNDPD